MLKHFTNLSAVCSKALFLSALLWGLCWETNALHAQPEDLESGVSLHLEAPADGDGGQRFFIRMETNDPYQCGDAYLANTVSIKKQKITVRVLGVVFPDDCPSGMGPASTRLDFSELEPGLYDFKAIVSMQVLKGQLEVGTDHYRLTSDVDEDLMSISNGLLNVLPRETVWGRCKYKDPAMKEVVESMVEEMREAGAEYLELKAGSYGMFYMHYAGRPEASSTGVDSYEYPFVLRYSGDRSVLEEIAGKYLGKVDIFMKDLYQWHWPNKL